MHRFELRKGEKPPIEVYIGLSNFHFQDMPPQSLILPDGAPVAAVQGRVEAGLKPVGADDRFPKPKSSRMGSIS